MCRFGRGENCGDFRRPVCKYEITVKSMTVQVWEIKHCVYQICVNVIKNKFNTKFANLLITCKSR